MNWGDGLTANPRTDANATNNLSVTANFVAVNLAPPVILPGLNVAGGNFNFQFTGTPGQHYRVEFTPVLPASGPWPVLTASYQNSNLPGLFIRPPVSSPGRRTLRSPSPMPQMSW